MTLPSAPEHLHDPNLDKSDDSEKLREEEPSQKSKVQVCKLCKLVFLEGVKTNYLCRYHTGESARYVVRG